MKKIISLSTLIVFLFVLTTCKKDKNDNNNNSGGGVIIRDMIYVEGGSFEMGCTAEQGDDCYDDEKPVHTVTLSSFYIGKYEVTQKEWKEVMGSNPSYFKDCDDCPVEQVSCNDIQEFLTKLNQKKGKQYRLPTEAEWEYAARGGNKSQGYQFSGSNDIEAVAWYYYNSGGKTHPVGQKQANELDLYDMSGNVWEWCQDWYASDYYSSSPQTNPQGPSSGFQRVLRGGCWCDDTLIYRVANRNDYYPYHHYINSGFRVVLPK